MKKLFSVLVIPLLMLQLSSQKLQGKYIGHHPDLYFFFDKGMTEFSYESQGGGISIPLKGIGKFNITSNYLLITTVNFYDSKKIYYSKVDIEVIIEENRILVFKIVSAGENKISLLFLDNGSLSTIYSDKLLESLEKKAREKYVQPQVFKNNSL